MAVVKLQYSLLCEHDEKDSFLDIIHGFKPGIRISFYVINKWIWDEEEEQELKIPEAGYYQITSIIEDNRLLVSSSSEKFRLKLAHTHHNKFKDIEFKKGSDYRLRVNLFKGNGQELEGAGIEYPLYVRKNININT